jgi:hypothetical protein
LPEKGSQVGWKKKKKKKKNGRKVKTSLAFGEEEGREGEGSGRKEKRRGRFNLSRSAFSLSLFPSLAPIIFVRSFVISLSLSLSGDYLSADQTEAAPLRYLSSNQTPSSSLTGGSGGKR